MRRLSMVGLGVLLAGPCAAQDAPTLALGMRVRVTAAGSPHRLKGTVQALEDRTLSVLSDDHRIVSVPRDAITRLEMGWGRKRNVWKGLLLGAALGAAAFAYGDTCDLASPGEKCPTRAGAIAIGAGTMGALGAGAGALIHSDQWVDVAAIGKAGPDRSIAPPTQGLGLSLSLRF